MYYTQRNNLTFTFPSEVKSTATNIRIACCATVRTGFIFIANQHESSCALICSLIEWYIIDFQDHAIYICLYLYLAPSSHTWKQLCSLSRSRCDAAHRLGPATHSFLSDNHTLVCCYLQAIVLSKMFLIFKTFCVVLKFLYFIYFYNFLHYSKYSGTISFTGL